MQKSIWTLFVSSLFFALSQNAHSLDTEIHFDAVTGLHYLEQIDRAMSEMGIETETSNFKVPATEVRTFICIPVRHVGGAVDPCGKTIPQDTKICPDTVPVKDSEGKIHHVPVNCEGPDPDGNCECEFR